MGGSIDLDTIGSYFLVIKATTGVLSIMHSFLGKFTGHALSLHS